MTSPVARDKVSLLAPGAKGTTKRIGFAGHAGAWLSASALATVESTIKPVRSIRVFIEKRQSRRPPLKLVPLAWIGQTIRRLQIQEFYARTYRKRRTVEKGKGYPAKQ